MSSWPSCSSVVMVLAPDQQEKMPAYAVWASIGLVGATTFGMVRWSAELLTFGGHLGDDNPPTRGSGLGLATTLLLCGGALLLRWRSLTARRGTAPAEPMSSPAS